MKFSNQAALGVFCFILTSWHAHGALLRARRASQAIAAHPERLQNRTHLVPNGTEKNLTDSQLPALVAQDILAYASCYILPSQSCTVNVQKVAADFNVPRVILFFGCSLDIFALNYFCNAAKAPVVGFTRAPGNQTFGSENLAYCRIGQLVLAYSFHPGASGPPYFEACEGVLHKPCSQVRSDQLIQHSVASIMRIFGVVPNAIVVDSSLWDAANWWMQDGKPPEPYVAPVARVNRWCTFELPTLINAVQAVSPSSIVAYRTAPRVEHMEGFGHSMQNIEAMNACFRSSSLTTLSTHSIVDYNILVETFLRVQGGVPSSYYEDAFHPGVLPSILYIDLVLKWAKGLPVVR